MTLAEAMNRKNSKLEMELERKNSKLEMERRNSKSTQEQERRDSRVFQKNTFSKKKNKPPPHVPLWGIYNPDPKAFFVWTSLGGQTTYLKMRGFYIVDFHSALSWPG